MELLDKYYIYGMVFAERTKERVKEFFASEEGISGVVVAIVLMLIALLMASMFWDKLQTWLTTTWNQIMGVKFEKPV